MPLILDDETVRIELPSPGEWVLVKARLSRGDRLRIQQRTFGSGTMRPGETAPEIAISNVLEGAEFAALEVAIKGWSFPEPVTPENIRRLDDESFDVLKRELDGLYDRPEPEKKDSGLSGLTIVSPGDGLRESSAG